VERPIVIVGASLAGLRAAQAIRKAGHGGRVVVVGAERHAPYTRPPLSKELLAGEHEADRCALPGGDVDVEWRLGTVATGLDLARREVVLAPCDEGAHGGGDGSDVKARSGDAGRGGGVGRGGDEAARGGDEAARGGAERLGYDRLLIATGARPRRWPGAPIELDGVHMLRDLDDALALRAAFDARPRLAVVGAGFIGCEVAATARKRGLDVTLIDVADHPMTALGPAVGARCADLHRARGVELRLGVGVDGFEGAGRLEAVRLADGSRVEADLAVVALGAIPNTDWLADSGLELQPGVVCDATLAARDADGVFCAGDVAAWPHPMADHGIIRIEHWTNAAEQGAAAGRNLLASPEERTPYNAVPYFWSDQYDVKIQSVGLPARAERVTVLEAAPEGDRLVLGGERDGRLVAAIGFNAMRRLAFYRGRLAAMPPFDEVVAAVRADEKALGDPAAVVA
jgi:3-phenylpropionate/trans-cinnamate dioxygenase ferredoxin reductase component